MTIAARMMASQVTQEKPFWIPKITLAIVSKYSGTFLKYFLYIVCGWVII